MLSGEEPIIHLQKLKLIFTQHRIKISSLKYWDISQPVTQRIQEIYELPT